MNSSIAQGGDRMATAARRAWRQLSQSLGLHQLPRHVWVGLGFGVVAALGVLLWVSFTDYSGVLDGGEAEAVRTWAMSTQAPGVAEAFNAAARDGQITYAEVRQVMEAAKEADMPQGLYQPVARDVQDSGR